MFDEEAYVDNSDKIAVNHRQRTALTAMDSVLAVWAGAVALQPSILCTIAQSQTLTTQQSLTTVPRGITSNNRIDHGRDVMDQDHASWAGLQALLALLLLPRTSLYTDGSTALSSTGNIPSSGTSVVSLPQQIAEWTSRAFRAILTLSSHMDDGGNHNQSLYLSKQQPPQASVRSQCNEEKDDVCDDDVYDEDSSEDRSGGIGNDRQLGVDMDVNTLGVFTTLQWRLFRSLWSLRPPLLLSDPMPLMHLPSVGSSGGRNDSTTTSTTSAISDEGEVGKHVFALLLAVVEGPPPTTTSGHRQGLNLEWGYRRKLCSELFQELRRASASADTLAVSVRPSAVAGTLSLLRCLLLPLEPSSSSSSSSSSSEIDTMVMMNGAVSSSIIPKTTTTTTTATTTITTHHANGFSQGTDPGSIGSSISGGGGGIHRPFSVNHASSPNLSHDQDVVAADNLLHYFVADKGLLSHLMVDCLGFVPQDAFLTSLAATQQHPPPPPSQATSSSQHPHQSHHKPIPLDEAYRSLPFAGLHPLCADDTSKKAAFSLLQSLCHWRPALIDDVFRMLQPVVASLPALSVWDYKPYRETRSSTGFVGLRNKGCTCYMNALLQVGALSSLTFTSIYLTSTRIYLAYSFYSC